MNTRVPGWYLHKPDEHHKPPLNPALRPTALASGARPLPPPPKKIPAVSSACSITAPEVRSLVAPLFYNIIFAAEHCNRTAQNLHLAAAQFAKLSLPDIISRDELRRRLSEYMNMLDAAYAKYSRCLEELDEDVLKERFSKGDWPHPNALREAMFELKKWTDHRDGVNKQLRKRREMFEWCLRWLDNYKMEKEKHEQRRDSGTGAVDEKAAEKLAELKIEVTEGIVRFKEACPDVVLSFLELLGKDKEAATDGSSDS
ncbi:hypothetical protein BS50DRAFT_628501 [Corynespora cassiicola Philippines]|uniref:Uncharacterized protein n=1 Tax=Corynespora cassiicola Philippines TaxID=1448308 RepID=A0A2T2PCC2_CORCC|nr:hypothetical protein BS50DRAFT_628501 [Corynespora cassiicola Philippines]